MRFERLEILNFASYYGEHAISLNCTDDKPAIIFLGGTGYGKTSLFDAINWALYGEDYENELPKRRRGRNILDYVNEVALQEAERDGKYVEMSCTLYFKHDDIPYYITQSLAAKPVRTSDNTLTATQTDRITTLYEIDGAGNHRKKPYNTIFLDEILPSNVKDYFLFDGDRIYNLTKPDSSEEVREAIYRVVDLELLQNAQAHLEQVAAEYRRMAKNEAKGRLGDIEEKYDAEHKQLTQLKADIQTSRTEKQSIESQLNAIEAKLQNLPDTSKLQGRRDELTKELQRTQNEINQLTSVLREKASIAGLSFAAHAAQMLVEELDTKRKRGEIPKAVSQTLLKDLLKMKKCICGTTFEEGDPAYITLTNRLQAEQNKSNQQTLLDLRIDLGKASVEIEQSSIQLKESEIKRNELLDLQKELRKAIEQVDAELEKLPKEDVAQLTREARKRREASNSIEGKIQRMLERAEACERRIKEFEKQREKLGKQQAKVAALQLRETFASQAAQEIDKIYDIFAEQSRQSVEALTLQEFKHFVRSSSAYTVALNNNYELVVLDSNGNRALQRLSMGQSQCLSLAFITAISRVSEKNPPLAIDMPFGRLDQSVHKDVSARLPELTNQLLLFLIPEIEWNDVTRDNLKHKASHIYWLDFDETSRKTEIREL